MNIDRDLAAQRGGRSFLVHPAVAVVGPRQCGEPVVDVDGHVLPDVVLEVDYSTDVRVWKLPLYEEWGFPEVWVDVPDERLRPRSRRPGLTIHVHDGPLLQRRRSSLPVLSSRSWLSPSSPRIRRRRKPG